MAGHFTIWPPPWERNSTPRRVASFGWLLVMAPVFLLVMLVAIPMSIVSRLTGWGATKRRTRAEVSRTIAEFVDGGGGPFDWDDFLSVPDVDPTLEEVRLRCVGIPERFPADDPRQWCGPGGFDELRQIVQELSETGPHAPYTRKHTMTVFTAYPDSNCGCSTG